MPIERSSSKTGPVHGREPVGFRVRLGPVPLAVVDQPGWQLACRLPVFLGTQRVHLGHDLELVHLVPTRRAN